MIWNECSLNVSDTCGCAAWHVAPTPRTVMLVAMQARSVHRVLLACQICWFRRVARTLGSPCANSSPLRGEASPRGRQGRLGQSGCISFCLASPAATPDHLGGASCIQAYFLRITRITRPIAPYFSHITRITREKKKICNTNFLFSTSDTSNM